MLQEKITRLLLLSCVFSCCSVPAQVATSLNYTLQATVIGSAGGTAASPNYSLLSVTAQPVIVGNGATLSYTTGYGFIFGVAGFLETDEGEGEDDGIHSADQDRDNRINLSELLRVIQFYNSGGLHCEEGTEDGYTPGPGDTFCVPHASDYNLQDWFISLSELLRLVQLYNSGGYYACAQGEDGFCPGPA